MEKPSVSKRIHFMACHSTTPAARSSCCIASMVASSLPCDSVISRGTCCVPPTASESSKLIAVFRFALDLDSDASNRTLVHRLLDFLVHFKLPHMVTRPPPHHSTLLWSFGMSCCLNLYRRRLSIHPAQLLTSCRTARCFSLAVSTMQR
jgi:hypothetical protein